MIQRGDIVLYSGKGFFSRAIKRVTRSSVSHCAWVLSPDTILEADWSLTGTKGVQVSPLNKYAAHRLRFFRLVDVPSHSVESALLAAHAMVGDRYDWTLFFSIFRVWLGSFFGHKPDLEQQRYGWICSELVAWPLWVATGISFTQDRSPNAATPADILRAAEAGILEEIAPH